MESLWSKLLEARPDDDRAVAFGKLKMAQKAGEYADLFATADVQETLGPTF